jgi:hypothetical protein
MKKTYQFQVIFGVLMAMTTQHTFCRDVMPYSTAKIYQCVGGTQCLHKQHRRVFLLFCAEGAGTASL